MDFEKLHYPSIGHKILDYLKYDNKFFEIFLENNKYQNNLIDYSESKIYMNNNNLFVYCPKAFYECEHHIKLFDKDNSHSFTLKSTKNYISDIIPIPKELDITNLSARMKIKNIKITKKINELDMPLPPLVFEKGATLPFTLNSSTVFTEFVIDDYMYFIPLNGTSYKYNLNTNEYTTFNSNILPSGAAKSAEVVGNTAFIYNVYDGSGYVNYKLYAYTFDPETNTLTKRLNYSCGGEGTARRLFHNCLYGFAASYPIENQHNSTDIVDKYDTMTFTGSIVGKLPAKKHHSAVIDYNQKMFILGGCTNGHFENKNHVYEFDCITNTSSLILDTNLILGVVHKGSISYGEYGYFFNRDALYKFDLLEKNIEADNICKFNGISTSTDNRIFKNKSKGIIFKIQKDLYYYK